MGVGAAVLEARTAAGISRDALARKTGLTPRTIFRIEHDQNWSRGSLALIAAALDVPFDDLIHDQEGNGHVSPRGKTRGPRTSPRKQPGTASTKETNR